MTDKYIKCYFVKDNKLPVATKEMNYYCSHFCSKVIQIIKLEEYHENKSVVIVEMNGSYPFVEAEWEKFTEVD